MFVLGLAITHAVARDLPALLKTGVALPIGFGSNAFLMFLLDLVHVPINSMAVLLSIETVLVLAALGYCFYKADAASALRTTGQRVRGLWTDVGRRLHPAWLVLFGAMMVMVAGVLVQAFFWPVFIYDSITGFDFVARVVQQEGTLNNSIFDPAYPLYTLRSLYPPMAALNFAYWYGLGFSSSQGVVALFYVSMAVSFYALLRLYTTHPGAALFTLLLIITPEFANFSAMSSSNPVCAFYISIGLLCLYVACAQVSGAYGTLGMLLVLFGLWTRPEAIVFAVFAGMFALYTGIRHRAVVKPLVFGVVWVVAFGAWQFYIRRVLGITPPETLSLTVAFDMGKLARMLDKVWTVTFDVRYYGIVVYFFLGMLLINLRNLFVWRDRLALLILLLGGWAIYVLVFYQIDTDYKAGSTNWIEDAYRRGLFCFFPLLLFYTASNRLTSVLFKRYLDV